MGGLAGGLYGLFSAPQTGASTRGDLTGRWHDLSERVAQSVAAVDSQVRATLGRDEAGAAATDARPIAASLVGPAGPFVEADGQPVLLLPDPLEPDPIVETMVEVEELTVIESNEGEEEMAIIVEEEARLLETPPTAGPPASGVTAVARGDQA